VKYPNSNDTVKLKPMDPEIKALWVTALRDGGYVQCSGLLKNGRGEHCVLGVLCELHSRATGTPWGTLQKLANGIEYHEYMGVAATLEDTVAEWAKYDKLGNGLGHLVGLNDFHHWPFSEIANFIEEHL
jgi:hypothetical protein